MRIFLKSVLPALSIAIACAACPASDEAETADAGPPPGDSAAATPPPAGDSAAAAPMDSGKSNTVATVRYEHVMTCTRFMGRAGQFFVYRITGLENYGSAPFALQPAELRIGGEGGAGPVLSVPEFSELQAAPGTRPDADETFLLERGEPGPPPHGPVPLGHEDAGVDMARGTTEPAYDEGTGCDQYNT